MRSQGGAAGPAGRGRCAVPLPLHAAQDTELAVLDMDYCMALEVVAQDGAAGPLGDEQRAVTGL